MLSENNILQNKSFSIHFFKNGFSFCTDDNINYFSHPTDKIEFENLNEQEIEKKIEEKNVKIDKKKISFFW